MSAATEKQPTDRPNPPESVTIEHPIVFFDGVCGLCSRVVDFVMARDPQGVFRFAPLQGQTARSMLTESDTASLETMAVAIEGQIFRRSAAAVRILWGLGPFWRACGWMLWGIPRPIRDAGYRLVAQSRYRLFGKHETCRLPTPEERQRFLP